MSKKISIIIVALVVILAVIIPSNKVFAANKKVNTVEVTQENGKVIVSGDVESGMLAVAIQVLDNNGNLVKLETGAVDANNKYNVEMELVDGNYVIKVADYDGGEVVKYGNSSSEGENATGSENENTADEENETSKETTVTVNNSSNPSTGDRIMTFVSVFAIALAVMIIALIVNKSKKVGKH